MHQIRTRIAVFRVLTSQKIFVRFLIEFLQFIKVLKVKKKKKSSAAYTAIIRVLRDVGAFFFFYAGANVERLPPRLLRRRSRKITTIAHCITRERCDVSASSASTVGRSMRVRVSYCCDNVLSIQKGPRPNFKCILLQKNARSLSRRVACISVSCQRTNRNATETLRRLIVPISLPFTFFLFFRESAPFLSTLFIADPVKPWEKMRLELTDVWWINRSIDRSRERNVSRRLR